MQSGAKLTTLKHGRGPLFRPGTDVQRRPSIPSHVHSVHNGERPLTM
jgi:hypothetical protein